MISNKLELCSLNKHIYILINCDFMPSYTFFTDVNRIIQYLTFFVAGIQFFTLFAFKTK